MKVSVLRVMKASVTRKLTAAALVIGVSLASAAPALAYRYPPVFRVSFVRSCMRNDASYRSCECVVSYMEARESFGVLLRQIERYEQGGPLPAVERQGAHACGLHVL